MPAYEYDPSRTNYNTFTAPPPPTARELYDAYVENAAGCSSLACAGIRRAGRAEYCSYPTVDVGDMLDTAAGWKAQEELPPAAETTGQGAV